jgi:hypothetical protein
MERLEVAEGLGADVTNHIALIISTAPVVNLDAVAAAEQHNTSGLLESFQYVPSNALGYFRFLACRTQTYDLAFVFQPLDG